MKLLKYRLKEATAKDLSSAISLIKDSINHNSFLYNEIIIQEGRFLDTMNYFNLNIAEKNSIDIEKAKIRRSILDLIDRMSEEDIKLESSKIVWWEELPFEWEKVFEPIVGLNPSDKRLEFLLKSKRIVVKSDQVSDLSPLSVFQNLEELVIDSPNIEDFSAIKNLKTLKIIVLSVYNEIPNFKSVVFPESLLELHLFSRKNVPLNKLVLPKTVNINRFGLYFFEIQSLDFLKNFEQLDALLLIRCNIEVFNFDHLEKVDLKVLHFELGFRNSIATTIKNNSTTVNKLIIKSETQTYNFEELDIIISRFSNIEILKLEIELPGNGLRFYYNNEKKEEVLTELFLKLLSINVKTIDLSDSNNVQGYRSDLNKVTKKTILKILDAGFSKNILIDMNLFDKLTNDEDIAKISTIHSNKIVKNGITIASEFSPYEVEIDDYYKIYPYKKVKRE